MYRRRFMTCWMLLTFCVAQQTAWSQATDAADVVESETSDSKTLRMVETKLADGKLLVEIPEMWQAPKVKRSRMVEREFAIEPVKGDETPGRLTIMKSGGSVKQNVERWIGQFSQPDNKPTQDVAKVVEKKINGQDVVLVDIPGTFQESMGGGPVARGQVVERKDYRMLGGIVQTKAGQYFFKLYGPAKTMAAAEKPFAKMMDSVKPAE